MIILQVTKSQGFTLSLENTILEKPQGVKLTPSIFRVKWIVCFTLERMHLHIEQVKYLNCHM